MSATETILVVDDSEQNIDILVGLLKDYDLLVALDGMTALDIVANEHVDLILLDIVMPDMDGLAVCSQLQQQSYSSDIPVIFITAKDDEDSIEQAFDVGGLDYVTKPFKPKELLARIKTQLKLKSLINHLDNLSSYDQMTGIFNRRKFFELATERFNKEKNELCGMMLDIDKFKSINDQFGHPVGDKVIKSVATAMQNQLPEGAIFGRLGGEEFAVVLNQPWQSVCNTIEQMRAAVSELSVVTDDNQDISFTISGGLVKAQAHHKNIDQLLKAADDALYEAKGAGRNKSIFRD